MTIRNKLRVKLRPNILVLVASAFLSLIFLWAIFPTFFANFDPYEINTGKAFQPPNSEHWFGTDSLGRDLYSRMVFGTKLSLPLAVFSVALAFAISVVIGVIAGFRGGFLDNIIMRGIDVLLALPGMLVALMLVSSIGFGMLNLAIAVAVGSLPGFSRLIRAEVLRVRSSAFVESSFISGAKWYHALFRHVVPHSIGPVTALVAIELGGAILAISALSYLGFGASPPTPEWGQLLSDARDYMASSWWPVLMPGLLITATVLSLNIIGRSIEDKRGR